MYTDLKLSYDDRGTWNKAGIIRALNGSEMKVALDKKATELLGIAKALWEARRRHESDPPITYGASFFWRRKQLYGLPTVDAGNEDPRWFFVEFGVGHGQGLPGYRYRILGNALDVLSGGSADKTDYEWSPEPQPMEFTGFVEADE